MSDEINIDCTEAERRTGMQADPTWPDNERKFAAALNETLRNKLLAAERTIRELKVELADARSRREHKEDQ